MQVRNIQPRGRRRAKGKEATEKQMLAQRRSQFVRHDPQVINKPFMTEKNAPFYLAENQRFVSTGAATEEKSLRDQRLAQKKELFHAKRSVNINRERTRWKAEEKKYIHSDRRMQRFRETGQKAVTNKLSVPYDTINHKFKDGLDAERLGFKEKYYKYRADTRKDRLYSRANGRFNPITGAEVIRTAPTQKPATPPNLKHLPAW
eukprot:CAMPEP_0184479488 /NCGR_PEP_ID=MMETSP0113_2-20130426/1197_1 /TAXON_ID=91329 /ORGANISM="Norrisiella sphaerica, Strain BC52" /LENGTH=203 /DNA_ID=CAMNT_0026857587 /DNA_START=162 /DNA_END=770 /DNA_ORIENTATION=+